jgi:predicted negative regulator of RcsB-dependent stress response
LTAENSCNIHGLSLSANEDTDVAKKYTRKQLKKPDEFISFSMRAWDRLRRHASRVIVMVIVAVLITGGVWTWSYFANKRAAKATGILTHAFDIYNQTVVPMAGDLPPSDDGTPRFKTREAKLKAADKEFTKALDAAGGRLKLMTLLMRAGVRYEQGRYDDAAADYKQFLEDSDDHRFRFLAQEGLGYCYEAGKSLDKALEQFKKLPREGDRKWVSIYHEARILAKKGKKKEAAKLLQEVVDKASGSLVERASDQLALLEG